MVRKRGKKEGFIYHLVKADCAASTSSQRIILQTGLKVTSLFGLRQVTIMQTVLMHMNFELVNHASFVVVQYHCLREVYGSQSLSTEMTQ